VDQGDLECSCKNDASVQTLLLYLFLSYQKEHQFLRNPHPQFRECSFQHQEQAKVDRRWSLNQCLRFRVLLKVGTGDKLNRLQIELQQHRKDVHEFFLLEVGEQHQAYPVMYHGIQDHDQFHFQSKKQNEQSYM